MRSISQNVGEQVLLNAKERLSLSPDEKKAGHTADVQLNYPQNSAVKPVKNSKGSLIIICHIMFHSINFL
jgi:hypothetical protein